MLQNKYYHNVVDNEKVLSVCCLQNLEYQRYLLPQVQFKYLVNDRNKHSIDKKKMKKIVMYKTVLKKLNSGAW